MATTPKHSNKVITRAAAVKHDNTNINNTKSPQNGSPGRKKPIKVKSNDTKKPQIATTSPSVTCGNY